MAELRVERLSRAFGGALALKDVSLAVAMGERRALIGPNGAGKTTLFRLIGGELRPSGGAIYLDGRRIDGLPPERIALLGVVRSFQVPSVFPDKSCLEHAMLALLAGRRGRRWWPFVPLEGTPGLRDEALRVLERVGLEGQAGQPAAALSHGDRRLLELAMALAQRPRLLLLDEPLAGLSPPERERIGRLLLGLPRQLTVLLIEHDLAFAYAFSERVTVLHGGEVLLEGRPEEVRSHPRLLAAYAGPKLTGAEAIVPREGEAGPPALQVSGLACGYGQAQVLHGVDLEVGRGEVVALLGRNGMGKTTLLHAVAGLLRPRSGRVVLEGRDVTGLSPLQLARAGLSLVPQGRRPVPGLSVQEELSLAQRPGPWTVEGVYSLFPRLWERRQAQSTALSGGEQQMLAVARALVRNPRVLLMDEPFEGLGMPWLERVQEVVRALRSQGVAVVLAEQRLDLALPLADRVYVLEQGRTVYQGPSGDARTSERLLQWLLPL
jgi:branched-chain amino acid transport system ATP-binding protein